MKSIKKTIPEPQRVEILCEALLFDFDGVVADSVEVKTEAFAKLFESYGEKVRQQVVDHHRSHGGMPRREKFLYYYQHFLQKPLPPDIMENLCRSFSELVVDAVVAAKPLPGVGQFLRECYCQVPCFIVSATPDEEIREIVRRRGLSSFFVEVRGASKTKAEHIAEILHIFRLNPGTCLFLGDAESDYQAARQCGVNFVAVAPSETAPLVVQRPELCRIGNFDEFTCHRIHEGPETGDRSIRPFGGKIVLTLNAAPGPCASVERL